MGQHGGVTLPIALEEALAGFATHLRDERGRGRERTRVGGAVGEAGGAGLAGAEVVDPVAIPTWREWRAAEFEVLLYEFKDGLDRYLADSGAPVGSLEELIAWNTANADRAMPWFAQELLEQLLLPMGLMGLVLFYAKLGWVAGPGRVDIFYDGLVDPRTGMMLIDAALAGDWDVFWNALDHLILPATILGFFSLAYIARMTRSFMLDQLGQEYITTARVKGVSEWRVIWVHALDCSDAGAMVADMKGRYETALLRVFRLPEGGRA